MQLSDKQKAAFKKRVKNVKPSDERKVLTEYSEAEQKAKERGASHTLLDNVKTLWQMLWEPTFEISWATKSWILFALGYFIMPMDLIPDAIPAVGYVDDTIVVGWVISIISEEIDSYRQWNKNHLANKSRIE